jgi:hypothetical protein
MVRVLDDDGSVLLRLSKAIKSGFLKPAQGTPWKLHYSPALRGAAHILIGGPFENHKGSGTHSFGVSTRSQKSRLGAPPSLRRELYKGDMSVILNDALRRPDVFCWFGAIPAHELRAWTERNGVRLPSDLLEFWRTSGGGDVFESETILRPNVARLPNPGFVSGDDTDSVNDALRRDGLSAHLLVFQVGAFLSAVDLRSGKYVTLSEGHSVQSEFASFEEWYLRTLRAEFGARYGLSPL